MNERQEDHQEPVVYLQTWPTTCGIACMMMILNYLGYPIELSRKTEMDLRHKLKLNRGFDIVPAINLGSHLKELGLTTQITHETPQVFWEKMRNLDPALYEELKRAHERAQRRGVVVDVGSVTGERLKGALSRGACLLAGIALAEDIRHAILLYKFSEGKFFFVDPLSGKRSASERDLLAMMQMDTGAWFIDVRRHDDGNRNTVRD